MIVLSRVVMPSAVYTASMRILAVVVLCIFATLPASAQTADSAASFPAPLHPATAAQVQQIIELSHAAEGMRLQLKASIDEQKKTGPKIFPAAFWDDFETEFERTDLVKLLVPIYQKYYSTEDAAEIIRFYSTPAGQKLIAASQPFLRELLRTGQDLGRSIGGQLGAKYAPEIEANIKKQQAASAPEPPK